MRAIETGGKKGKDEVVNTEGGAGEDKLDVGGTMEGAEEKTGRMPVELG